MSNKNDRRKKKNKVTAPEDILQAILRGDILEIIVGKKKKLKEKK